MAPEDNARNQPEPDIFVVKRQYADSSRFWSATPQPADIDLVVEISDTSLQFDLTTKASLYARAQIAEYWVLDVIGRRLLVHRNPQEGQYESVVAYAENESVATLSAPESAFRIEEVFPQ